MSDAGQWYPLDGIWHSSAGRGAYHLAVGKHPTLSALCRPGSSALYEDGGLSDKEVPRKCGRCLKIKAKQPTTEKAGT